jgi:hypothetical protein
LERAGWQNQSHIEIMPIFTSIRMLGDKTPHLGYITVKSHPLRVSHTSGTANDEQLFSPQAKIYANLNEEEVALSRLERGLAAGAIGSFYKVEPVWDPISSDPRFGDLRRRMGRVAQGESAVAE